MNKKKNLVVALASVFGFCCLGCGCTGEKEMKEYIVTFFGDSITEGYFGTPGYVDLIAEQKGIKLTQNMGIACSTIGVPATYDAVTNKATYPFVYRYKEIWKESDVVVILGGSNDYGNTTGNNVALGTSSDRTETTFYGALHVLIDGIRAEYPNIKIVMCTPLQRDNSYTNWPIGEANEFGNTLEDYRNAVLQVAQEKEVDTLDLYSSVKEFDCTGEAFDDYFQDGIHPNSQGHRLLAGEIYKGLAELLELD